MLYTVSGTRKLVRRIVATRTDMENASVDAPRSMPSAVKGPDIASASIPDTLAALRVNPETGLTDAEAQARLKQYGYNEVAERKGHPALRFLGKFWGLSAWMLELI